MPAAPRPHNAGPSAAPKNRAAILSAARTLFAQQGYHVPLNAIARAAGVGQGVLYRHFPHRIDLALAVFDDNFAELEAIAAAQSGQDCFGVLWRRLVTFTVESTAFIDMVIQTHPELPETLGEDRLARIIAEPLARAQGAGLADPSWQVSDVLLFIHMVHGVVIGQAAPDDAAPAVQRALELIDPRLTGNGDGSFLRRSQLADR